MADRQPPAGAPGPQRDLLAAYPTLRYRESRAYIKPGDLLLFRSPHSLIARASGGPYSHAAIAFWHGAPNSRLRTLFIAECREFYGARIVTCSSAVRKHPGRIDVWRPLCPSPIAAAASEWAARKAGHDYAYWAVVKCGLMHLAEQKLGVEFDRRDDVRRAIGDEDGWYDENFCSWQTVYCYRRAAGMARQPGHLAPLGSQSDETSDVPPGTSRRSESPRPPRLPAWDPCPGLAGRYCEPNHLAQRGGFELATLPDGRPLTRLVHRQQDDPAAVNVLPLQSQS